VALELYRSKRDFTATAEPRGRRARKSGKSFVIQKHDATRLHYDLRLEMDGVLKSWAVTRGPSLVPTEKRLAVHVEDHPLDYGDFEGTIPKGEYGAGTVLLWDRGTWAPIGDMHKAYAKGHLEFELSGSKLAGRWHLVRMRGKPGEKRENWLLIKGDDEFARSEGDPDILEERPESVKTGRDIPEIAAGRMAKASKASAAGKKMKSAAKSPAAGKAGAGQAVKDDEKPDTRARVRSHPTNARKSERKTSSPSGDRQQSAATRAGGISAATIRAVPRAKKGALPSFMKPMLAKLSTAAPKGDQWLHEIKFDGYRLQARIDKGSVRLLTRTGLDWTERFGTQVAEELAELPVSQALLDGELVVEDSGGISDFSTLQADLSEGRSDRFVFYLFDLLHLDGFDLRGAQLTDRKSLLERLLAPGTGHLRYSEHFDDDGSVVLRHACRLSLEGIVSKRVTAAYRSGRGGDWVKSKCTKRQEFVIGGYVPSTVSRDAIGSLALGVYEGQDLHYVGRVGTGFSRKLAEDLHARLAPLELRDSPFARRLSATERRGLRYVRPELVAEIEFRAWTGDGHLRHAAFQGLREDKPAAEIVREEAAPQDKRPALKVPMIKLTHPDRIYWPDRGISKQGLADYYAEVWPYMKPHVVNRPLALLRCPTGIDGERFFQKHAWKGMRKEIVPVTDPQDGHGEPLIAITDLAGLLGLVQAAALEIHPWGSTLDDWEHPDLITMDLDPGDDVSWEAVVEAAGEVCRRLESAGLVPFVKTSGGKGLHVVAPLKPVADWVAVKAFTKALADGMAADEPALYVSTIAKSKRKGRILIDYLRNQRGATAVAAYSVRARPGAAVSTPVFWDELAEIGPAHFTVENLSQRLTTLKTDPWADFRKSAQPLKIESSGSRRKAKRR